MDPSRAAVCAFLASLGLAIGLGALGCNQYIPSGNCGNPGCTPACGCYPTDDAGQGARDATASEDGPDAQGVSADATDGGG